MVTRGARRGRNLKHPFDVATSPAGTGERSPIPELHELAREIVEWRASTEGLSNESIIQRTAERAKANGYRPGDLIIMINRIERGDHEARKEMRMFRLEQLVATPRGEPRDLVPVRFLESILPYRVGERAGFDVGVARELIDMGVAKLWTQVQERELEQVKAEEERREVAERVKNRSELYEAQARRADENGDAAQAARLREEAQRFQDRLSGPVTSEPALEPLAGPEAAPRLNAAQRPFAGEIADPREDDSLPVLRLTIGWQVLGVLCRERTALSQDRICDALSEDRNKVSRALQELDSHGYVEAGTQQRRRSLVTPAGIAAYRIWESQQ